ncbi:MAG: glycoside hydrolase family 88 protein [Melioribacteraceae bacterium]|nr:glycoside hydrolase family 88 protein [Melioribacteraceae bacterium]
MLNKLKFIYLKHFLIIILTAFFLLLLPLTTSAFKDSADSTKFISLVSKVIDDASFKFIDYESGEVYSNPNSASQNVFLNLQSAYNDWRYWNGVLNIAMLNLSEVTGDESYRDFAVRNVGFGFNTYGYYKKKYSGQNKWSYPFGQFFTIEELDDCGAIGASVIEVHKISPHDIYEKYIIQSAEHISYKQSRLNDGTFVRSFPFKWTLWADDLYMSVSFLSRMYEYSGDEKYLNDAVLQVLNFNNYLFDENKGLMCHNWYSDLNQKGVAFWGRANGWALLAQVDLLDVMPETHSSREQLIKLLNRHVLGIIKYQSASGLWHQLLDKNDSYLETSCSAMFTYTIARAVNKGFLDKRFTSAAIRGWEGVLSKIRPDGMVEGVCTGTVVSDNLVDYYNRPAPLNDVHGIGTVILAGSEILILNKINKLN